MEEDRQAANDVPAAPCPCAENPADTNTATYDYSNIPDLIQYRVPTTTDIPVPHATSILPYRDVMARAQSELCSAPIIHPADNSLNVTFFDPVGRCDGAPPVNTPRQSRFTAEGFSTGAFTSPMRYYGCTINGVPTFGFCLDHTKATPVGSYGNVDMPQAFPIGTSLSVMLAVSYAISVAPTDLLGAATEGQEMFNLLGNACTNEMNSYDAWGVVQAVVWCLLGQGDPSSIRFINCPDTPPGTGGTLSPAKLQCLSDAVQVLYQLASDYGNGNLSCGGGPGTTNSGSGGGSGGCACNCPEGETAGGLRMGCQLGKVFYCNTDSANNSGSDTYLVFVGCANDLRELCGRVLLGPFKLDSTNAGNPTISLVACDGCTSPDIALTDYCGCKLSDPPAIGDEFYITFRPPCTRFCFDLKASMLTTRNSVYYFRKTADDRPQPIGLPRRETVQKETSVHVCIDLTPETPPPPPPEPEPWWEHILINNNNNNNNNDNNDNNSNLLNSSTLSSLVNTALENLIGSLLLSGGAAAVGPAAPFPGPPPGPFPGPPPFPGPFPGGMPPAGPPDGCAFPGAPMPGPGGLPVPGGLLPKPCAPAPPYPPPCPPPYMPPPPPPYIPPMPPPEPCLPDPCCNTVNVYLPPAPQPGSPMPPQIPQPPWPAAFAPADSMFFGSPWVQPPPMPTPTAAPVLLLPERSSAPHPAFPPPPPNENDAASQAAYYDFFREWYQE
ncbi:MAG: hypothetical protein LBG83_05185 [Oscillospiraceae bacterium]|jgi:hypothetical protein|nr:hypothetical protein [Oscillospiraceae bacterium]